MNRKTILLTGATGFLGSHLLKFWISKGHSLIILKRSTSSLSRIKEFQNKIISYDIDVVGLEKAFLENKIDAVVHTATDYGRSKKLSELVEVNVIFTLRCIELSKKHEINLFINTDTFFNKNKLKYSYLSNYTLTKRMTELSLPLYADSNFTILNAKLEHVYGPNDNPDKFVSQILAKLIKNEPTIELTEGTQKRDFIFVNDVVSAYDVLINNYKQLNQFNEVQIGTGLPTSIRKFVQKLKIVSRSQSNLNFGALPLRVNEISESFADITLLNSFGWTPKYNFSAGIEKLLNFE